MQFRTDLSDRLRKRLQSPLPGIEEMLKMSPPSREKGWTVPDNARKSGVLVLIYPMQEKAHIVYMKRTEDGHAHSGQISFPGGRHEDSDPNLQFTALREAEEEMSISPNEVEVIGPLSELYIPPSNSLVFPTLAVAKHRPTFVPEPNEVAKILEVSVAELQRPGVAGEYKVFSPKYNVRFPSPGYKVLEEGHIIWGATAMMTQEVLAVLSSV